MKLKNKAGCYRRLLFCFTVLVFTMLSSVLAFASTAHITFTNEPTNQPDLYVTKTVSCTMDGYDIPDIEFTFALKWDLDRDGTLSYAANEVYTLYSQSGTELYNYDADGNQISFSTDSYGNFTLKAGQVARFEYAGTNVAYEITETSPGDNWIQVSPASGLSATGYVSSDGTMVTFENQYVPETTTVEEFTSLTVSKYTVGSDNKSLDTDETFTFTLQIAREAWAEEAYVVYDFSDNELGTGVTDENGTFTLSGNQKAVFSNIPVLEDYSVTEAESANWNSITQTTVEGATASPMVYVSFTNQIKGGKISFTKTSTAGELLSGAIFDIYSDNACTALVSEMVSGADGTVLSNELTPGTYYVKEVVAPENYALSADVYTVTVPIDETVLLTENGIVTNTRLGAMITLTKIDGDTGEPLADAVFGVYSDESCTGLITTMETDDDGSAISIKLDLGTYYVKEITAPDGYLRSDTVYTVVLDGKADTVSVTEDGTVPNTVEIGSIKLVKKDENGKALEGVTFKLSNAEASFVQTATTDKNGEAVFENLPAGTYTVTETETVSGQSLLADSFKVTIPLQMTKEEADAVADIDLSQAVEIDDIYYFYNLTYEVTNSASLTMPTAGSSDLIWIPVCLFGAFVIFGGYAVYKRKKKGAIA